MEKLSFSHFLGSYCNVLPQATVLLKGQVYVWNEVYVESSILMVCNCSIADHFLSKKIGLIWGMIKKFWESAPREEEKQHFKFGCPPL